MYVIQHSFICRPSDSTVSEDAGIEPRTVATSALTARRSAKSHPQTRLDLNHTRLDLMHTRLDLNHIWLDLIHTRLDLIHTKVDLIHTRIDLIHSRLDLIHTRPDLIHSRLDLIHWRDRYKLTLAALQVFLTSSMMSSTMMAILLFTSPTTYRGGRSYHHRAFQVSDTFLPYRYSLSVLGICDIWRWKKLFFSYFFFL
jgi:nestin